MRVRSLKFIILLFEICYLLFGNYPLIVNVHSAEKETEPPEVTTPAMAVVTEEEVKPPLEKVEKELRGVTTPGMSTVEGAKGTLLRPFGYDFFLQAPSTFAPLLDLPPPLTYILGPGDTLRVVVWSTVGQETVYTPTISPAGQV